MSTRVYISHKDPVDALIAGRDLMLRGSRPFVPQLNKLIPGLSDKQWEDYYKIWMIQCDCVLKTKTFREHELSWAREEKVPIVDNIDDAVNLIIHPQKENLRVFARELESQDLAYDKEPERKPGLTITAVDYAEPLALAAAGFRIWARRRKV